MRQYGEPVVNEGPVRAEEIGNVLGIAPEDVWDRIATGLVYTPCVHLRDGRIHYLTDEDLCEIGERLIDALD